MLINGNNSVKSFVLFANNTLASFNYFGYNKIFVRVHMMASDCHIICLMRKKTKQKKWSNKKEEKNILFFSCVSTELSQPLLAQKKTLLHPGAVKVVKGF